MWTHFLTYFYFIKIQLVSAYYLGAAYYQGTQYYPQFYAPNNNAPLICFIYFPGFAYYPQLPAQQQQQQQQQHYPIMPSFYGRSIYQTFTAYSEANNRHRSSKTYSEQSKPGLGSEQPLPIVGVPLIIPKVPDDKQMDNKLYNIQTTPMPTTVKSIDSEITNVDKTEGSLLFPEINTDQPQKQNTTEQFPTVSFVTLPIFIAEIRTTQQSLPVPEVIPPSTTTEFAQTLESITEGRWPTTIQSSKVWQPTEESSTIYKENDAETKYATERPEQIAKEWTFPTTNFDNRLFTSQTERNLHTVMPDSGQIFSNINTELIQTSENYEPSESSVIFKEENSEKELKLHVTEPPQEIVKEWITHAAKPDSHLAATTQKHDIEESGSGYGSGSGDGSTGFDDEDGF